MQPASTTEPAAPLNVLPDDHAGVELSMGLLLLCTAAVLAQIGRLLWRAFRHRRAARADAASHDPHVLFVPGDTVLFGGVEYAQDATHAVSVEVEQLGTEQESSGSWSHRWTEIDRRVRVAPFYLRGSSGQRIRVEPPEEVQLVDELDGKVLVDKTTRIRTATLVPGEAVYVRGTLASANDPEASTGYRGSAVLVMRAPAHEPMLISSEPLGARFTRRVKFHLRWAAIMLASALLVHASATEFHALAWAGKVQVGAVDTMRHFVTTDSEGDDTDHYELTVQVPGHETDLVVEVDHSDYKRLSQGSRVKVRSVRGRPDWRTLGDEASAHGGVLFLVLILTGLLLLLYAWRRRATRPWYLKKVVDGGSGRLPEVPARPG
jgi:hypothetical protein